MALRSHEVVVSGHPRRSLCFVLTVFAVLSGCNCQKKGGTPTIVGSGGEPITVSTLDFGFVAVGQKLQLPLPIRNGGAGVLDIGEQFIDGGAVSSYSQPVPFATAIAAGGSDSSAIEFTPQDAGLLTSALTIQTDGTPAEKVVMLTGTGLDINVAASPSSLNFGSVQVDVMPPPTLQVTFTNNGSQPAQLTVDPSATYTDGGTAPFTLTDNSGNAVLKTNTQTLSAGGTYVVTVAFEPNQVGNFTSSFSFTACANASACLASQAISLNGVGVTGLLCITPDPIGFANVPAGNTVTQSMTVANCGTNAVNVQCVYLASTGNSTCDTGDSTFAFSAFSQTAPQVAAPLSLQPSQTFTFTLSYTASSNPLGDSDTLDVDFLSVGTVTPVTQPDPILGNQMLNPCTLTVTPAALNFGTVTTGTPVVKAATLSNSGDVACDVTGVALDPSSDPSYALDSSQATSLTINAGASATITVDFNLNNSSTPNTRKGIVDFASNDPAHATDTIPLIATLNSASPYAGGWPKWHLDNNNSGQSSADTSANTGTVVWQYTGMKSAASLTANGNPQGWTTGDNGCGFTYLQGPVVADDPNSSAYYIYQMGLDGTLYGISQTGTLLWSTMTSDPSTDPHPSTPAVLKSGNIWAVSGSDAYNKASKQEAHLNALFLVAPDGGFVAPPEPYGKDGFDACPGLAPDGTLFEADDNAVKDAGTGEYADPYSVIAFQASGATINLETGLYLPLTQVSERFGVAIGDDDTSFWGNNGQFFSVTPPASGFAMSSGWPAGGVTVASNTSDKNAVGTVFSDLALDPINTNFVYAYTAWEDGTCTGGGYYGFGTCTGPYKVAGTLAALSIATGALKWTVNLPSATFPTGWVPLCSDYGNAAPAVATDGTVYVGNGDGLRAFVGSTGMQKWFFPSANVSSAPAIGGDGTVFFGCSDGSFYAVNSDGSLRYKKVAAAPVSAAPAIADDGTVFFTSDDGMLWAVK